MRSYLSWGTTTAHQRGGGDQQHDRVSVSRSPLVSGRAGAPTGCLGVQFSCRAQHISAVARRTSSAAKAGARIDMELDAALLLVLAVPVGMATDY